MNPAERKLNEQADRIKRLTRQCGELQARNRELELAMDQIFSASLKIARTTEKR